MLLSGDTQHRQRDRLPPISTFGEAATEERRWNVLTGSGLDLMSEHTLTLYEVTDESNVRREKPANRMVPVRATHKATIDS